MSQESKSAELPTCPPGMPATDLDIWSDAVLADPYPAYRQLRDIGAVVWMNQYGMAAFPRFAEVRSSLARWQDYSSTEGVSSAPMVNAALPPAIINTDPPAHETFRGPLAAQLSVASLASDAEAIQASARAIVDRALQAGTLDGVADFARPYSLAVVGDLAGIPEAEREGLPHLAESAFNVMGAMNHRVGPGMGAFGTFVEQAMRLAQPGALHPGCRAAQLVDGGQPLSIISYTWPGIDTTVNAVASAVYLFAKHPDQWELLRSNRGLIPSAFAEVLRLHAPVHHFTRVATSDQEVEGVTIPAGTRVLEMYGSANRDERHYPDPDRFDISRNPVDQLAFGRGIHLCVGQNLAKMEGHAVFAELADRVERFEFTGEPEWMLNNTLHGLARLPVRVIAA
jgi:cytochrome P450